MSKTRAILFVLTFSVSGPILSLAASADLSGAKRSARADENSQVVAIPHIVKSQGSEGAPIFIKNLANPESEADVAHKQYERHEKPALDRRLTIATELLAVFTFLLFCFTAGLWWVTYRLSRDARDVSTRQSADSLQTIAIAQQAANAAKASAEATELAAQTMKSTASHQLRAYVCIGEVSGTATDGRWEVRFEVKNVGSTIARRVNYSAEMQVLPYPLPANTSFLRALRIDQDIAHLGPGQGLFGVALIGNVDTVALSKAEMQRTYLYGTVVYTDIFERLQETNFCYVCNLDSAGTITVVNAPQNNSGT